MIASQIVRLSTNDGAKLPVGFEQLARRDRTSTDVPTITILMRKFIVVEQEENLQSDCCQLFLYAASFWLGGLGHTPSSNEPKRSASYGMKGYDDFLVINNIRI